MWSGSINYTQLRFEETKGLMEHKLVQFKKGVVPRNVQAKLARDWSADVDVDLFNPTVLAIEAKALAKRYKKMDVLVMCHLEADQLVQVYRWMS
jgi:hypothetical protein